MTPNPIRIARTLLLLLILLAGCATPAENLPAAVHTVEAAITALPDKVPPTVAPAAPTVPPASAPPGSGADPAQPEQPIRQIFLDGPMAELEAEISSMAWYGDYLILMPQYPNRYDNNLYWLAKADILAYLYNEIPGPLLPTPIPFRGEDLPTTIFGYEGLEGIDFLGNQVFFTVESRPDTMRGYILAGQIAPDMSEIRVDTANLVSIQPQADLANMTDETILVVDDRVITLYEANGVNVNPNPVAHVFGRDLSEQPSIPFPNVEYRINDASLPDADGIFWVINYFWPGDQKLLPIPDPIAARWGQGQSHSETAVVERLLPMRYTPAGITLADVPPVQLALIGGIIARNWEGLVLLDDLGFLLVTDKHPSTILAFVPRP
ncbi:MAG: hypothetical protein KAZ26_13795 [Caldilineaceae bacterium]|nr:hypothetical protein [Caldilineaceae bacterium]